MKKTLKKYLIPGDHNDHSPHILKPKVVASVSLTLILLKIAIGLALAFMPFLAFADTGITSEDLLNCTNENRSEKNLNAVVLNPVLSRAAAEKLEDMDKFDYWAHYNPENGTEPWLFYDNNDYEFVTAGENLAFQYKTSEGVCKGWMDSPTHRANILDETYQEVGFAIKDVDLGAEGRGVLVVQFFGSRMDFRENPPSDNALSDNLPSDEDLECAPIVEGGPRILAPECGYTNENRPEIKAETVEDRELNFRINEKDYEGEIVKEGQNRIVRLPEGYELPDGVNKIEAYLKEQNKIPAVTSINVDTKSPVIDESSVLVEYEETASGGHKFHLEISVKDTNLEKVILSGSGNNGEYEETAMKKSGNNYSTDVTYESSAKTVFPVTVTATDKAGNTSALQLELTAGGSVKGLAASGNGATGTNGNGTSLGATPDLESGWRYLVSGFLGLLFIVAVASSILYKFKHENEDYLHLTGQAVVIGILLISSVYFII